MSDAADHGITVTEIAAMDQPIDASVETISAFVGRALRGPLNTPILINSFAEFRRRFGENWRRSGLGPAVMQFFEHGGTELYVVRVANAARGAMLCLPAEGTALVLRAVEPGSLEQLRAAVDYDRVSDDDRFNLTLQRIDPDSGRILDQEIHENVSFDEESDSFVGIALTASTLAHVEQPYPHHRPEPTETGYLEAVQRGHDGADLSDYDLIGSRGDGTGLFALNGVEHIDLVYLAAPGLKSDVGPTAVFAAELYCRERGAMLIVDPRNDWESAADAVRGMRDLGYASPNLVGYFPRILDRELRAVRAAGGAIAGLLSRLDRDAGTWHLLDDADFGFARRLVPDSELTEAEQKQLERAGLNVLATGAGSRTRLLGNRTMGRGNETHATHSSLSIRRTCLRIVNIIDHSTRWAVFEQPDPRLVQHIQCQVNAFFAGLADLDAFEEDHYSVDCEPLVASDGTAAPGIAMDIAFQPAGSPGRVSLTLQQSVEGLRVVGTAFARSA